MRTRIATLLVGSATVLGLSSGLSSTHADVEHFCNGSGVEVIERWPVPGELPWTLHTGTGLHAAPGYPPLTCQSGIPNDKKSALASIYLAAGKWTNVDSNFSIDKFFGTISLTWPAYTSGGTLFGQDTMHLISLHEPAGLFAFFGAPAAIAITGVFPDAAGNLLDADIAVNCRSVDAANVPFWSFVEDNLVNGGTLATGNGLSGFQVPVLGYVDLEGALAHEFGHFAGLGHSLIDSIADATSSRFPTMFPFAQVENFSATLALPAGGCASTFSVVTGAGTQFNGVLGRSARTLEADDIHSIQAAYPQAAFLASHGAIKGTVYRDFVGVPELGASVIAVKTDEPDVVRVGTLSFGDGVYSIDGLPPGTYHAYVEPIAQRPTAAAPLGYYFDDVVQSLVVPNYVFLGPSGCVPIPPLAQYPIDYFDSNELASPFEFSFASATPLTVVAGGTTTADFLVTGGPDMLTVRSSGTTNFRSPRGLIVTPTGGVFPAIELTFDAGPAAGGQRFALYRDTARASTSINGQVRQVSTVITNGFLPASGAFTFVMPLGPGDANRNIFFQATTGSGANQRFSNGLNVWVTNP